MKNERTRRGLRLREAREANGYTQMELAEELGYRSPQFVSNWERGLCDPTFEELPHLCKLLSISKKEMIESYVTSKLEQLDDVFRSAKR